MSAGAPASLWEQRLVDDAVYAYVEWREESATVWAAYDRWAGAAAEQAGGAHAAYRAALDREEAAAQVYASLVERVSGVLKPGIEDTLGARGSA
jgi:hypothetical protein